MATYSIYDFVKEAKEKAREAERSNPDEMEDLLSEIIDNLDTVLGMLY